MAYKTTYPYTNEVLATFDNATDEALEEALAMGMRFTKSGVLKVAWMSEKFNCIKLLSCYVVTLTNTLKS